jgi:hypothetical protein
MSDIRSTIAGLRDSLPVLQKDRRFTFLFKDDGSSQEERAAFVTAIVNLHTAIPSLLAHIERLEKVAAAARLATNGIDRWERFESIGSDRLEAWENVARALAALEAKL